MTVWCAASRPISAVCSGNGFFAGSPAAAPAPRVSVAAVSAPRLTEGPLPSRVRKQSRRVARRAALHVAACQFRRQSRVQRPCRAPRRRRRAVSLTRRRRLRASRHLAPALRGYSAAPAPIFPRRRMPPPPTRIKARAQRQPLSSARLPTGAAM